MSGKLDQMEAKLRDLSYEDFNKLQKRIYMNNLANESKVPE